MVQLYEKKGREDSNQGKQYQLNPITEKTFLKSLNEDYKSGIALRVKRTSQIFRDKWTNSPSVYVTFEILSQMPNCLSLVVENNQYKQRIDVNGNSRDVLQRMDATFKEVSILFKFKEGASDELYFVSKRAKAYPFFLFAMKERGLIPSDYNNHFDLDFEDLQSLIGLEFVAKSEKNEFDGNEYYTLLAEKLESF